MDWTKFKSSECYFLRNFLPVAADLFLGRSTEFIATFYSSQIGGDYYVTGIGIASQMTICTIVAFIFCYGTVFECYAGATLKSNGKPALGNLLYKCQIQAIAAYALALGPFLCISYVIPLFGEDANVHKVAVSYLQMMCLRPLLLIIRDTFIKYLVVQGYWFISLILTAFCGVPTIILLGWLFVVYLDWGMAGLAAAQYALVLVSVVLLIWFVYWKRKELEIEAPTMEIFTNWGQMFKLGSYAGFRGLATFAVSAIAIAMCQVSGPTTAEAVVIIYRVLMPFGATAPALAYSQAITLGNSLGKKDEKEVKYSLKLGGFNLFIDRILTAVILLLCLPPCTAALSKIPAVREQVQQATWMVTTMLVLRGIDEFLARGILTPLAKQACIAITSIVAVYVVSVPLMTWLIYVYHVEAVWIFGTTTLGMLIQSIVYIGRLCCLNIEVEIEKSAERTALKNSDGNESLENGITQNGHSNGYANGGPKSNAQEMVELDENGKAKSGAVSAPGDGDDQVDIDKYLSD